jgi:hypothetical protein
MTWIGDGSIELGEPIVDGAPPDRFVRRTGGGMQGVAVWVEDFDATTEHLAAHGVPMPVVVDHFGFTSPRATHGIQFEWSDFTVPEDPRAGAPDPPFVVPPLLDVTYHAFVGAGIGRESESWACASRTSSARATSWPTRASPSCGKGLIAWFSIRRRLATSRSPWSPTSSRETRACPVPDLPDAWDRSTAVPLPREEHRDADEGDHHEGDEDHRPAFYSVGRAAREASPGRGCHDPLTGRDELELSA